ncbi:response regulator transcription factor [Peribacillus asahii]|uniref:Two-component response regulator n=1 Tax=Peribacillus asahii TaxID=228899 RepID=A0A3Q9RQ83_9BACI|nr:response regulator transcription factor [Peribacillus asahii]AZV44855.1 two-component response regulator [Peribacillus asahii]USK84491.1 response regulator transcription factor [Peribacillus asahii]
MNNRILIVEDDHYISEMIRDTLVKHGFAISTVFDGEEALKIVELQNFDLILLDIMIPKIDGMECLKIIRNKSMIPILILSAKGEDVDKALGLGFGADDYIAKPFSMIELVARVKAILRRERHYIDLNNQLINPSYQDETIQLGDLIIDMKNYSIKKCGHDLKLTLKEFNILKLFITNPNQVFTKAQVYNLVWQDEYYGDENVINVHIRRLREKIEDNPSNPKYIKTLWGIGYKLGEF